MDIFDYLSGKSTLWLIDKKLVDDSKFTEVDYIIGRALFIICSSLIFILSGWVFVGNLTYYILTAILVNIFLSINDMNDNGYHATYQINCMVISGVILVITGLISNNFCVRINNILNPLLGLQGSFMVLDFIICLVVACVMVNYVVLTEKGIRLMKFVDGEILKNFLKF